MGDARRNKIFAQFIKRNYPNSKTILVVADGLGELASCLMAEGYCVRVVEAKLRDRRKRAKGVDFIHGWFTRNDPIPEDLIIALHPDEATAEVVIAAQKNKKPFAIVPCCILGTEAIGIKGFHEWIKKLIHLSGGECKITTLPIKGQNLVVFRKTEDIQ